MKGFFSWFKAGTKMKRWMLLILIGVVLACYGLSNILIMKELAFIEVGKIAVSFMFGFSFIVIGLIFAQKRTLELLIESTDSRITTKKDVNLKSLIFNKKIYNEGPNIVVIGGGSGLNTVLSGLKNYTNNVTAIVTVSEYKSMPSDSRTQLNILPLDDIKDSLISLSIEEKEMSNLMNLKFQKGRLNGLKFSDIYLLAMEQAYGDFAKSIEKSKDILNITGKVLPVTLDEMTICAELKDGTIIDKKDKICETVFDKVSRINRIYLSPSNCRVAPGVLETIQNADCIIIGPGSLYTNVIPNLLVKNVAKTIKESKALKIYVNNIMTEPGQTDNYTMSEHVDAIIEHAGTGVINYCICDTGEVIPEYIKKYNKEGAELVEQDIAKIKSKGINVIQRNLSYIKEDLIRHNPEFVANSIIELICDDLRYKDKKDDPQYVMLNSKLKLEKKIERANKPFVKKQKKNKNKKVDKHTKGRKSKFNNKYKERIESIQTSDENTTRRKEQYEDNLNKQQLKNLNKMQEKLSKHQK